MVTQTTEIRRSATAAVDAAEAAKRAADAAQISAETSRLQASAAFTEANASVRANELTERAQRDANEAYQRENRARVIVDNINFPPLKAGERIQVQVRFKNIGRTFALNYRQNVAFQPAAAADQFHPVYRDLPPLTPNVTLGGMEPNGTSTYVLTGDRPITVGEAQQLMSGTFVIFIWGRVGFDDIFGHHRPWQFCQRLDPRTRFITPCEGHDREQ
jgi:hypothetical protein